MNSNRLNPMTRAGFAVLMASTMLTSAGAAFAQEAGSNVDEVIVTAQKRSENLQTVPSSALLCKKDFYIR
jgi:outer membrane receptor protein involved in Fe transport